jgi:hypothetical protein
MGSPHVGQLFDFLYAAFDANALHWQQLGNEDTFGAARKKFMIFVDSSFLWMVNSDGCELLRIRAEDDSRVAYIYDNARCVAQEQLEKVVHDFIAD